MRLSARPLALLAAPLLLGMAVSTVDAQRGRGATPPQHRRQRPQLALEGGGLYTTHRGDALGNVGDGRGFDIMGSVGAGLFSIGAGYQRQGHNQPVTMNPAIVDGGFVEPRLALPIAAGNFTPYVLGRAARLTRRTTGVDSRTGDVTGTALGVGAGNLFWLAPNVQLNTAILWQDLRFGRDRKLVGTGSTRMGGSHWGLRVGLVLGFNDWGR